jgi:hypothetical protein
VLVVGEGEGEAPRALPSSIPITYIETLPGAPAAIRRVVGLRAAAGEVIAVLEDTVRPVSGWGLAVLALHHVHLEADAIGGTLALSPGLSTAEAALLALAHGPFLRQGDVSEHCETLPENDLSFKRRALDRTGVLEGDLADQRDVDIVARLAHRVSAVRCASSMGAVCVGVDPRRMTPRARFQEGWLHGRQQLSAGALEHFADRLTRVAAAPLTAAVRIRRGALALSRSAVARNGRSRSSAAWSRLLWMGSAWSLGETAAYLLGKGPPDPQPAPPPDAADTSAGQR